MSAAAKKSTPARRAAKRDLVYGLGTTGLSVARHFDRAGRPALYVDSRTAPPGLDELRALAPDAEIVVGDAADVGLDDVERIIASPGIADSDPLLAAAREAGIDVVSDIELFTAEARADFVAVTGSNGKSTVTTLVALMCKAAGRRALAGGNLGTAALDLLAEDVPDVYVLELSSFQLQRTRHLPARVAVLLNVSPDHLDWHADEAEYREAKLRIYDQARAAVVNRDDETAAARVPDGVPTLSFGLDTPGEGQYGIVTDDGVAFLARGEELLLAADDLRLIGDHNRANALAALAAGQLLGLDMPSMLQVLLEFPGLPHRMQFVARIRDVDYINDSKATNVGAAVASVLSVSGPVVLIAGGQGKGGDFAELADAVHERLVAAILIGEDAAAIAAAFGDRVPVRRADDLGAAVAAAREIAAPGDTVLLAPACASFDQFDNYMHRGDTFAALVRELGP